ncbi:serine/threonine-protein kinase [Sphingomonas sp. KR3-1]|uniref:serine/threonine-protein kinase n=1 Tax=Sphingomonas sp. KR3-1 TaxID=3156611 RepID=UPI0032B50AE4
MQASGEPDLAQVLEAFDAIEPLESAARQAALARLSPAIAERVSALLEASTRRGILDAPAPTLEDAQPLARASLAAGTRVGGFELEALVGRGGMGEVYRARRADVGFEQQVALKLLRIDAIPNEALFARERRMLARLDHPGIARLIDGGVTPEGRPWMAMAFVEGQPIDQWVRAERPSLEARLRAFRDICDAVAYAHANLIVHRDLKPSNILIDARGRIHLLDFGIAKLVEESGDDARTVTGALMTPDYAAPEQLGNGVVTVATDVHALGVILYQLLAGATPWSGEGGTLSMLVRRVAQEDPAPPSRTAAKQDAAVAPSRIRGDLDAIVLKALRKDPAARYGSVPELAEDIERFEGSLPVRARAGSRRYRFGRFLRRNRWSAVAAGAVVLALAGGATGIAVQAHRTAIERDNAVAEAARSDSIVQTLTLMFAQGGYSRDLTLKHTLDESALRMLATLDRTARSGAAVNALSDLYVNMQDAKGSYDLLKSALEHGIGADSPDTTAKMQANLADAALAIGAKEDVAALLDKAQATLARNPERNGADLLQIVRTRAAMARRKGDYPTAIKLLTDNLPQAEHALTANESALLTMYNNLLVYMIEANRLADMDAIFARVDRVLAHPGQRDTMQALGIDQLRGAVRLRLGDAAGAERISASNVQRRRRLFGDTPGLAADLSQLAKAQMANGRFADARVSLLEARPLAVRFLGEHALPVIVIDLALAQALAELGETADAAKQLGEARAGIDLMPKPNPLIPQLALTEAVLAVKQGDKPAASAAVARSRAGFAAMGPAGAYGMQAISRVAMRVAAMR